MGEALDLDALRRLYAQYNSPSHQERLHAAAALSARLLNGLPTILAALEYAEHAEATPKDLCAAANRRTATPDEATGTAGCTDWMEPEYGLRRPELALVLDLAACRVDRQTFVQELGRLLWPHHQADDLADLVRDLIGGGPRQPMPHSQRRGAVADMDVDVLRRLNAKVKEARASGNELRIERARNDRYSWLEDNVPAILAALQRAEKERGAMKDQLAAATTPEFDALWEEIRAAMATVPAPTRAPDGAELIAAERRRQVAFEGMTPEHDDEHIHNQLSRAAASYIAITVWPDSYEAENFWPWNLDDFKPVDDPVPNLVKAGALIAAAIDRLLRKAGR